MVKLRTRMRNMRAAGGNHHYKLGLQRSSCVTQLTISDSAGICPNLACHNTDTRSFQANQASHMSDLSYLLISSTSFLSASPISLFLVHNFTIIAENKVKSSLSVSPCHDHELTPCTAYTKYSNYQILFVFTSLSLLQVDS